MFHLGFVFFFRLVYLHGSRLSVRSTSNRSILYRGWQLLEKICFFKFAKTRSFRSCVCVVYNSLSHFTPGVVFLLYFLSRQLLIIVLYYCYMLHCLYIIRLWHQLSLLQCFRCMSLTWWCFSWGPTFLSHLRAGSHPPPWPLLWLFYNSDEKVWFYDFPKGDTKWKGKCLIIDCSLTLNTNKQFTYFYVKGLMQ